MNDAGGNQIRPAVGVMGKSADQAEGKMQQQRRSLQMTMMEQGGKSSKSEYKVNDGYKEKSKSSKSDGGGMMEKDCSDFETCEFDCDALSECNFPGFNPNFLGDGFCDMTGCYNHKICGFDGGDCCEGSCVDGPKYIVSSDRVRVDFAQLNAPHNPRILHCLT